MSLSRRIQSQLKLPVPRVIWLPPRTGLKKSTPHADIPRHAQGIDGNRIPSTTKIFFKFSGPQSGQRNSVQCLYVFFPNLTTPGAKMGTHKGLWVEKSEKDPVCWLHDRLSRVVLAPPGGKPGDHPA